MKRTSSIHRFPDQLVSGRLRLSRRRRWCSLALILLGQQTKLINTGGTDFIDNCNDIAVFRPSVALHVNGLVEAVGNAILDLASEIIFGSRRMPQIDGA